MPKINQSTLSVTRSDTKNFCKCGKHSAYHCRFMGDNYDYCQKKKGGKRMQGDA